MDTAQKVTTKYEREDKALFEYTFIPIPNSESALREVFYRLNTVNADTEVFYKPKEQFRFNGFCQHYH